MTEWQEAQAGELDWWGNCANSYGEEMKQLVYARKMGLEFLHDGRGYYNIDLRRATVLDIGGGPCSMLLKCFNFERALVTDPLMLDFPEWVVDRYSAAGIGVLNLAGEQLDKPISQEQDPWDETWIYNVLQHTEDPAVVVENALKSAKIVRIFEWVDIPADKMHPCSLTEQELNEWLGGEGRTEVFTGESGCVGTAYYGVFKGKHYEP